jgi:hypothetical protein
MHVEFLGVGGFLVTVGDDSVMTAPLYTRPDMITVQTGIPVESDTAAVAAALPSSKVKNVRAVISGHAHYDHLLDVPAVLDRAPGAMLYSNTSAKNLLDAFAPDRDPTCSDPAPAISVARSRVVALDDPAASVVDYTNCPDQKPAGAPLTGTWTSVPGSNVRLLAVCSMHPDQVGPFHFAPGDVDTQQCTAPTAMADWKEGPTIAFLVDFLDPKTHAPLYRFYYQDAPTNAPIGYVPSTFLSDRRVDLALLCVGSYDHVDNQPNGTIDALTPRFSLGGHWEDFFQPASGAPATLPLLDVPGWLTRAKAAAPDGTEPVPIVQNGLTHTGRAFLPMPGDVFDIAQ